MSVYGNKTLENDSAILIGRRVVEARRDGDGITLLFEDGLAMNLDPEGDCCAHAFIQHVSLASALVGGTIHSVETIHSPSVDAPDLGVTDAWGHRIRTDKGTCSIEMRCEHNGYYGGQLTMRWRADVLEGPALEDF